MLVERAEEDVGLYFLNMFYKYQVQATNNEVSLLYDGKHIEYLKLIEKLEHDYRAELERIEVEEKEKGRIETEYCRAIDQAEKEYQERLDELMNTMLQQCEETKQQIEQEMQSADISIVPNDSQPINKKSLRSFRKPSELALPNEKRTRSKNPPQVLFPLTDTEIAADLSFIDSTS